MNHQSIRKFTFELHTCTVPPPDIGNRVAVRDRVRTAIAVHNFRIVVFCYAKRGSSAEENQPTTDHGLPLFSAVHTRFELSYRCGYSTVYEQFYKTFSRSFLLFCSLFFSSFGSQDEVTDTKTELTGNRHI